MLLLTKQTLPFIMLKSARGGRVPHTFTVRTGSDLGKALSETRRARGVTQVQLAEELGFDQAYLARLERGHSVQLLDRVVRALRELGAEISVTIPDSPNAQ